MPAVPNASKQITINFQQSNNLAEEVVFVNRFYVEDREDFIVIYIWYASPLRFNGKTFGLAISKQEVQNLQSEWLRFVSLCGQDASEQVEQWKPDPQEPPQIFSINNLMLSRTGDVGEIVAGAYSIQGLALLIQESATTSREKSSTKSISATKNVVPSRALLNIRLPIKQQIELILCALSKSSS